MSLSDALILVKEFEGIIGALLGVIVTMVLTKIFQSVGKVTTFIDGVKYLYYKHNEIGGMEEVDNTEYADYGNLTFTMELYNPAETQRALRNFKIVFLNAEKQTLFSINPKDEATRKISAMREWRDDLSIANISPKQIVRYDVYAFFTESQCKIMKECNYVYLEFHETNSKNRRRKLLQII